MSYSLTEATRHRWVAPIYGGLIIAIGLGQMMRKVLTDTGGFGSRYTIVLLGGLITTALVARSRERGLGSPWLWRVLFGFLSLILVALLGFGATLAVGRSWPTAGLCLGGAALLTPGWAGLWDYGFESPDLWSGSDTGTEGA